MTHPRRGSDRGSDRGSIGGTGFRIGREPNEPDEHVVTRQVVEIPSEAADEAAPGAKTPSVLLAPKRARRWLLGGLRRSLAAVREAILARDWVVVAGLAIVAALARLPGLELRGRFDGDQGHDMLVLLRLTRDGVVPLLGPQTSVGEFHHGAFYYFLLAPAAWVSGSDPTAVVGEIALIGIGAVIATWWLARQLGGPIVGLVAGLLVALSPAAVEESTFIWNPNPIPLFAALALGCAWRAHVTRRPGWWIGALACAGAVVQLHVLGIVFVPPILALFALDVRRARRAHDAAVVQGLAKALGAGAAIVAVLFLPLAIHEFQTGFLETRRVLDYLGSGGDDGGGLDPFESLVFTLVRIVGWPLVGLVTDVPIGATLGFAIAVSLIAWRAITARGEEGTAMRWLGGGIAWSAVTLTLAAPSLKTVVAGLPNDHYHAFVDPMVVVAVTLAGAALAGIRRPVAPESASGGPIGSGAFPRVDIAARTLLTLALVAELGLMVSRAPLPDPNGGWPAARAAGIRVATVAAGQAIGLVGLPTIKSPDGIGFPIVHAGGIIADDPERASVIVVACDRLFELVISYTCGGQAEDKAMQRLHAPGTGRVTLEDRFDQSPRISISIYEVAPLAP
jgi:hypothetical protein